MEVGLAARVELARLKALMDLVASTPITELDLTEGDVRIRISKGEAAPATAALPAGPGEAGPVPAAALAAKVVRAPMAGTFFTTPSPSEPPFARPGDPVLQGATICIIEAMKTLTRVPSTHDGTLLKVLAAHGEFVEFDQPLFEVG